VFTLRWSKEARGQYDALKDAAKKQKTGKRAGLFKQVHKTLSLLAGNPRHPGLNTHKYSSVTDPAGRQREVFEAYAQNDTPGAYRVFWCYGPGRGDITVIAITPHP
jgi:hypothetical protein